MSNGRLNKPTPKTQREISVEQHKSTYVPAGNPNYADPNVPGVNRALQTSFRDDNVKPFSIGIKDIDEALMHYFKNVLKLSVVQNNSRLEVPVIYGTPENWKSIQSDGYYRDENNKLMAPLLMFKRSSVAQNRNLGNKLDGNLTHNVQLFEKSFSKRNVYSNFSALNNRVPQKKYVVSATPDYITVEYECMVWTYFVEQMDKLVEALNFASRSYWGDPNRFQFYSSIESFQDAITYNVGDNRAVRTSFNLTLNGYLIPDTINKKLANASVYYGVSDIVFGLETTSGIEEFGVRAASTTVAPKSVLLTDSQNIVVQGGGSANDLAITYLGINKTVVGTYSSPTTAIFAATWAIAPPPLPGNNIDNFTFFVNGQYIEKTAITSFSQVGSTSVLVIDPVALQFSFDETDVILAIGKFN